MDVAEDGEVLSGSIEWHPDVNEDRGPEAITVLPQRTEMSPEDMFVLVLEEPWYQPALPFPTKGWVFEPPKQDRNAWSSVVYGRRDR